MQDLSRLFAVGKIKCTHSKIADERRDRNVTGSAKHVVSVEDVVGSVLEKHPEHGLTTGGGLVDFIHNRRGVFDLFETG